MSKENRHKKLGFTMIELVIVVVMLEMLIIIVMSKVSGCASAVPNDVTNRAIAAAEAEGYDNIKIIEKSGRSGSLGCGQGDAHAVRLSATRDIGHVAESPTGKTPRTYTFTVCCGQDTVWSGNKGCTIRH